MRIRAISKIMAIILILCLFALSSGMDIVARA
jgi:hypothetical protein